MRLFLNAIYVTALSSYPINPFDLIAFDLNPSFRTQLSMFSSKVTQNPKTDTEEIWSLT
jgi:BarA-like signal transduction histidine kinase